jgi:hypothetical protein
MLLITIVFAGILMYNFDRGLKTQRESSCNTGDRRFIESFIISGQKVQVKGRRPDTKRYRIRAPRSNAHTSQSNEHRLKPLSSFLPPYETDSVCASSTCILFILLLVDRGPPYQLLHLLRTFPAYYYPSASERRFALFYLTHDDTYTDRWSQDFQPSNLV